MAATKAASPRAIAPEEINPTGNRVLIEVDESDSVTPGGIILPDRAREKPQTGTVLATGPGERVESAASGREFTGEPFTVGVRVMFGRYAGTPVPGHDNLVIVDAKEVIATIE